MSCTARLFFFTRFGGGGDLPTVNRVSPGTYPKYLLSNRADQLAEEMHWLPLRGHSRACATTTKKTNSDRFIVVLSCCSFPFGETDRWTRSRRRCASVVAGNAVSRIVGGGCAALLVQYGRTAVFGFHGFRRTVPADGHGARENTV